MYYGAFLCRFKAYRSRIGSADPRFPCGKNAPVRIQSRASSGFSATLEGGRFATATANPLRGIACDDITVRRILIKIFQSKIFFENYLMCQIFLSYSSMVRSLLNTPLLAVLVMAIRSHLSRSV